MYRTFADPETFSSLPHRGTVLDHIGRQFAGALLDVSLQGPTLSLSRYGPSICGTQGKHAGCGYFTAAWDVLRKAQVCAGRRGKTYKERLFFYSKEPCIFLRTYHLHHKRWYSHDKSGDPAHPGAVAKQLTTMGMCLMNGYEVFKVQIHPPRKRGTGEGLSVAFHLMH